MMETTPPAHCALCGKHLRDRRWVLIQPPRGAPTDPRIRVCLECAHKWEVVLNEQPDEWRLRYRKD